MSGGREGRRKGGKEGEGGKRERDRETKVFPMKSAQSLLVEKHF